MDFESLDLLGAPFEHVETYVYYQGRRTFAMRSKAWNDLYYFVNTVDEDEETGALTTILVAASSDRYKAIRGGIVSFRDAFTDADPRGLSLVVWHYDDNSQSSRPTITRMTPTDVLPEWLPSEGLRLDLPTDTGKPFEEAELLSLSAAQNRTVFALEVGASKHHTTELPARTSGELQLFLVGGVDALAKEAAKRTKEKPSLGRLTPKSSKVTAHLTPMSLGTRAASYVFLMALDSGGAYEATEVTAPIFEELNALVSAVSSEDEDSLLMVMKSHSPRVRSNFRNLLSTLTTIGSGVSVAAVVAHTQKVIRSSATASQVRSAAQAIDTAKPKVRYLDVDRGLLTGHVLGTRVFVLVDLVSGATFRGHMEGDASASANGLPVGDASYVSGRIRIETPFAADDDGAGSLYVLESIMASDAPG